MTAARLSPVTLLFLVLPPLFWAGNAVVGRASVGHIGPLTLSFGRWLLAFMILLPFTASTLWTARAELRARWRDLLLISVLGIGIYNSLQYLALQTLPALNVTLLAAAVPVTTLAIGALFFSSPASPRQMAGAALSLCGVLWIAGRGSLDDILALRVAPGDVYMLGAITAWSGYTWLLRTRRPPLGTLPLLTVQIGIGALAILPFAIAEAQWDGIALRFDHQVIATLAYVTLFPSLIAYYCWDRGVARAGATLPVFFANLTPLFAALLAVLWLGEDIAPFHLVGAVLLFGGIALGNRR